MKNKRNPKKSISANQVGQCELMKAKFELPPQTNTSNFVDDFITEDDFIDEDKDEVKEKTASKKPPKRMLVKMESSEVAEADEIFPNEVPITVSKLNVQSASGDNSPYYFDPIAKNSQSMTAKDYKNIFTSKEFEEEMEIKRKSTACFGESTGEEGDKF
eukprot:CAMPEP_0205810904 /NCGR_PEP_ID=MMETSP0205-20121125/15056_1 /ASSEMBLY_ACC=CAM_ASM_000278 /TAXON_ID=36767 /ORGANISM="Euplotes focardii, Strain TN1" /LENGTH=158 /DNA_ID=CAMNT_0053089445 /DNA_START=192 /DNA_END=668 /DNA_ORIENTATION=-